MLTFILQIFKLDTRHDDGSELSVDDVYDNLLAIVESSLEKETPLGILTSENRDTWAECYCILEESKN